MAPALIAGAVALAPNAAAAPAPPMTVSVHPASGRIGSYFDLSVRPGVRTLAGTLEVRNRETRTVKLLLDPVDALTASTLGSAYRVRGLPVHGPTRWIRISRRRVTLAPRASVSVPVSIAAPRGARAGDYLAGIGIQARGQARTRKMRGNVAISSVQRYAVGVLARIPGPRHALIRLTRARIEREPAGVTFFIFGRNSGNVILQNVSGSALVTQGKRVVARRQVGPGTFVTRSSIAYPVLAPGEHPGEGAVYRVRAFLRYRGGIARLDTLVRFGHRSAVRQAAWDRTPGRSGGGLLVLAVVATGVLALLGGSALWLRSRAARSPRRAVERALVGARASGEPLSLIHVAAKSLPARALLAAVRPRLRRSDRIYRLEGSDLLIVAPDTPLETAEHLAAELRRQLERTQDPPDGMTVEAFAPNGETTAAELLERAS
jgi:hypothetical protein